jgi:hypothetical protein
MWPWVKLFVDDWKSIWFENWCSLQCNLLIVHFWWCLIWRLIFYYWFAFFLDHLEFQRRCTWHGVYVCVVGKHCINQWWPSNRYSLNREGFQNCMVVIERFWFSDTFGYVCDIGGMTTSVVDESFGDYMLVNMTIGCTNETRVSSYNVSFVIVDLYDMFF